MENGKWLVEKCREICLIFIWRLLAFFLPRTHCIVAHAPFTIASHSMKWQNRAKSNPASHKIGNNCTQTMWISSGKTSRENQIQIANNLKFNYNKIKFYLFFQNNSNCNKEKLFPDAWATKTQTSISIKRSFQLSSRIWKKQFHHHFEIKL